MKPPFGESAQHSWSVPSVLWWASALAAGSVVALFPTHPAVVAVCLAFIAYILFALKSIRQPLVFVVVFLLSLVVLPPIYLASAGDTPIYVSTLLLPVGLAVLVLRLPDFRIRLDRVAWGWIVFLLGLGLSLPFGWWLSGTQIGNQSFLRWLMLAQTALIYVLVRGGARREESRLEQSLAPLLVVAAVLTAAYGVFDFISPIPYAHPAADEYIWLRTSIVRRAQGVFYEAGNFANLCAFFLVVVVSAILSKRERQIRIPLAWLVVFAATLSLAVFVSFTRSTWASSLVSIAAFLVVSREISRRRLWLCASLLAVPVIFLRLYSLGLWDYLIHSRLGNLAQLFADPNLASSGRWETWTTVLSLVAAHPQYLFFGVGFKTLPFTTLFHRPIITDNGFLNLLTESGIFGLGGFLILTVLIFKTFYGMAGSGRGGTAFWGAVLGSFWCGECVQMMALDAYTYWRTLTVLVAVMGYAMNRMDRAREQAAFR